MASALVQKIVQKLASRTELQTESDQQSNIATLLEYGDLNLTAQDVVKRESQVGDGTRRRIDVEMGHLVIEVKRDLTKGKVLSDAEAQLAGYLRQREAELGGSFAGVLTDGKRWRLYRLADDGVEHVADLELSDTMPDADRLLVWLESIMATRTKVKATSTTIEELLGAMSPAHRLDHAQLRGLLREAAADQEVSLKRELWSKLLRTAYGEAFTDDEKLFVNHTLLVITAEAIAHAIVGYDVGSQLSPADLVSGRQFTSRQINGVVEQDFFDWPIGLPGGEAFVTNVARRVARFDWSNVEHDVLKVLYESVIEQRDRENLGEYYTPDWLAQQIVADRVTDPLAQRVLDPACGSGTFLFHAVRRYLDAADAAGIDVGKSAEGVSGQVFGIDIHPVAVTLARVTYLMAIGTHRLNADDRGQLTVPVFLGDSLQWERHADLFTNSDAITISTAGEDLIEGGGGSLFADDLVFPTAVWSRGSQFDVLVHDMAAAVDQAAAAVKTVSEAKKGGSKDRRTHNTRSLTPILQRHDITEPGDRDLLTQTFETWIGLQRQQRDRIWGYYVRNLVRPVWLARPENRVDVLVGNPPWLRYSKMTPGMQARYKELAKPRGLLTGGLGASARDLSTLFVVRAVELYLKDGGKFGFVMPYGTLSRKPHTGFRAGTWTNDDSPSLSVSFDKSWDLHEIRNLFPMTSCVVRGEASDTAVKLSTRVVPWAPPSKHQAATPLAETDVAAIDAGSLAASAYSRAFRQGAILVPRMLLFVERAKSGPLGAGAGRIEIQSTRSSQEKQPWKAASSLQGIIENDFVVGVHLGETIVPFTTMQPRIAVLPVTAAGIMTETEIASHQCLAQWWSSVEAGWSAGRVASETAPLLERMDYHGQLSSQFPLRRHRVVYTKSGNTLAATRLENTDESVIDHKLYWASCPSVEEARYLSAILNSKALLHRVAKYQAIGLFGARDFDKYVFQVGIPLFDAGNAQHRELAGLAARAEQVAAHTEIPKGIRFQSARKLVSDRLASDGVQLQIEDAVSELLPQAIGV